MKSTYLQALAADPHTSPILVGTLNDWYAEGETWVTQIAGPETTTLRVVGAA